LLCINIVFIVSLKKEQRLLDSLGRESCVAMVQPLSYSAEFRIGKEEEKLGKKEEELLFVQVLFQWER